MILIIFGIILLLLLLFSIIVVMGCMKNHNIDMELIDAIFLYQKECIINGKYENGYLVDYDDIYDFNMIEEGFPWLWKHEKHLPVEKYEIIKPYLTSGECINLKVLTHKEICDLLNDTYERKNADYGDSFAKLREEFPDAILIRLTDKLNRLKTLYKIGNKRRRVKDESIEDTLLDLANYCIMEVVERRWK